MTDRFFKMGSERPSLPELQLLASMTLEARAAKLRRLRARSIAWTIELRRARKQYAIPSRLADVGATA